MKVTTEVTWATGKTTSSEHMARYDGKYYPRFPGAPAGDEMLSRRIDSRTEESVQRKNGAVTVSTRRVVSQEGGTMTVSARSVAGAQDAETVLVYEKLAR